MRSIICVLALGVASSAWAYDDPCESPLLKTPQCAALCDGGNASACAAVQARYKYGHGSKLDWKKGIGHPKDKDKEKIYGLKARKLFEEACEKGNLSACSNAGDIYGLNDYPRDGKKADELYQKACDQGEMSGCIGLTMMYHRGDRGMPKDKTKAKKYAKKTCKEGKVPMACNILKKY